MKMLLFPIVAALYQVRITKSVSFLFKTGGWAIYNLYSRDHSPNPMLYVLLSARYHIGEYASIKIIESISILLRTRGGFMFGSYPTTHTFVLGVRHLF
ncbi:MAG: hypothetical protein OXK80_04825 [Bdellovibrionales bacterium]|nr:hypothetical protein [Bdellovibrionales bacterium]